MQAIINIKKDSRRRLIGAALHETGVAGCFFLYSGSQRLHSSRDVSGPRQDGISYWRARNGCNFIRWRRTGAVGLKVNLLIIVPLAVFAAIIFGFGLFNTFCKNSNVPFFDC